MVTETAVKEALQTVVDPELGLSIQDLGLVYKTTITDKNVHILMTFTSPACPVGPMIIADVKNRVGAIEGIEKVDVEITFDPMWAPEKATEEIQALFEHQM
jgi:metal-sulfur cluster biosynthetic enzyme